LPGPQASGFKSLPKQIRTSSSQACSLVCTAIALAGSPGLIAAKASATPRALSGVRDSFAMQLCRTEIRLWPPGHTGAVFGPFMLEQLDRGGHADILGDDLGWQQRCTLAPHRIVFTSTFGPETVQNKTEIAHLSAALQYILVIAAIFR
jgi:hypothetical protein